MHQERHQSTHSFVCVNEFFFSVTLQQCIIVVTVCLYQNNAYFTVGWSDQNNAYFTIAWSDQNNVYYSIGWPRPKHYMV